LEVERVKNDSRAKIEQMKEVFDFMQANRNKYSDTEFIRLIINFKSK
jgi:hypothetical protein